MLFWKEAAGFLLPWCSSQKAPDNDVLQSAIWGLGAVAKRTPPSLFQPLVKPSLLAIDGILSHPEAFGEDKIDMTENCIGALGKVAIYQTNDLAALKKFLQLMPLKNDMEEAQDINGWFLTLISQKNPKLLSQECQSLTKGVL